MYSASVFEIYIASEELPEYNAPEALAIQLLCCLYACFSLWDSGALMITGQRRELLCSFVLSPRTIDLKLSARPWDSFLSY